MRRLESPSLHLESVIDAMADPLLVVDRDHRVVLANRAAVAAADSEDPEGRGWTCHGFSHGRATPCDGDDDRCPLARVIATRAPVRVTHVHRGPDGGERVVDVAASPILDASGEVVQMVQTCRDVTDRIRVEEALAESRRMYAELVEQAADAILSLDRLGRFVSFNRAAEELSGYAASELAGRHFARTGILAPASVPKAVREFALVIAGQERPAFELTVRRKDGGDLIGEAWARCIRRDGRIAGVQVAVRDVTARRQAEERFRVLFESSRDAIMTVAPPAWTFTSGNPAAIELFGARDEEHFTSLAPWEVSPEVQPDGRPSAEKAREMIQTAVRKGSHLFEWTHTRLGGEAFPATVLLTRVSLGGETFLQATVRDITDRKRAEAALAERTEALARSNQELQQFAYVASHDLQEPLRMVSGYVQLLARRYGGRLDADADEFIRYAVDGAAWMQRLINDLLAYSRVGTRGQPFAPTDCEAVLEGVLANLEVAIAESGAEVTHDPLPTVMADEVQLGRLLLNLVGNAIKYRGEEPPRIHIGLERTGGAWRFSVRDNGIGIPPEYHDRVFAVFQRLHGRAEYEGTGVGLAVCKKIVERHGGRIGVESEPGRGSTFTFTLPAREVPDDDLDRDGQCVRGPGGPERHACGNPAG